MSALATITRPLRKKLALGLYRQYKKNLRKQHKLNYFFWECTLRCNLHCQHCGSDCKKESNVPDMPAADFLKAVDQITPYVDKHNTMIVITGGEALLRKDLEEVGRQLYQREFPWGFVTNGVLLTANRLQSLRAAGLRAVTVSLDGLRDSHLWLRGPAGGYKQTLRAIELLAAADDVRFDVVTCVNRRSLTELDAIREMLIGMGVKEWRLFTIFPTGRAAQNPDLQLDPLEFKSVFDFIRLCRKDDRIKVSYGCEGFLGSYEGDVRDHFFNCRAGVTIASVLVDGAISACPSMRGNFIQGNIYKDDFADVWMNRFEAHRNRSWAKTGECADCKSWDDCEGNGLHLRNDQTGELMFCHLKRIHEGAAIEGVKV
jgi:radical SAM enzyme (rSAM/lipoprotein system)